MNLKMIFSYPEGHIFRKALEYALESAEQQKDVMSHKEFMAFRNKVIDSVFKSGSVELEFRHHVPYYVRRATKYNLGCQIGNTLYYDFTTMFIRKGIPWAREYKHIML